MKALGLSFVIVAFTATTSFAAIGDQWILGIHHINEQQVFTTNTGQGYSGTQSSGAAQYVGNSYGLSGQHGQARIYWELSGNSIGTSRPAPNTAELYTVEYWGVPQLSGRNDYHVIESQFHGEGGEGGHGIPPWQSTPSPAYDEHIPWIGQFNTNHQWLRVPRDPVGSPPSQSIVLGDWNATGDGPQAPESADFESEGFGQYIWLKRGSWLFAKWDFTFMAPNNHRTWSAIRLTQITETTLQGDHDSDGDVDINDYVTWRSTNINGETGYTDWASNYGASLGSGAGFAVPEPASVVITLGCIAAVSWFSSRNRCRVTTRS